MGEVIARTELRGIIRYKRYRSLYHASLFVMVFFDRNTKYAKRAPRTRGHTCYSIVVAGVSGDDWQRSWSEEDVNSVERMIIGFRRMLVVIFDNHYDSGLYTLAC